MPASIGSNWARLRAQLPSQPLPAKRQAVPSAPSRPPKKARGAEDTAAPSSPSRPPKKAKGAEVPAGPSATSRPPKRARKGPAKEPLSPSIRLELGRWAVLDGVVEAYEAHVEPALGGADSARVAQKRKRHLESWLWARRFHPLLPLGKPARSAVLAANEALAQKLRNAGLRPKEASRRVRRLAKRLRATVSAFEGDVAVAEERRGDRVALTCGGRAVELLPAYLAKLRRLCSRPDFLHAAFFMLARYRILQVHDKGGGNQGAVPPAVFGALERWAAPRPVLEAFASPLNALAAAGRYHSAFADVDAPFGSRGSFFDASFEEGVVEVNPPFDEELVQRVAQVCEDSLERAAAAKMLLAFLVVVPETDWPGHEALLASKFRRWVRTLPAGQHFYQVGNQHLNPTRAYPASRNTTLLLLSSRPVAGQARLGEHIEAAFRALPA